MWRFHAGTIDIDGSGGSPDAMEVRMLPIPTAQKLGSTDLAGFNVRYGVGALLCLVATVPVGPPLPTTCTTTPANASPTTLISLVAVSSIPGDAGNAATTYTVGQYSSLNNPPGKPPIVASGSVDLTGTLQIVTNPNAGGPGVPVSVWTRKDLSKTGTPNTCYMDEFIRYGAKNNAPASYLGQHPPVIVCDTCGCPSNYSLSYMSSGNAQQEGIDILDIDGDTPTNLTPSGVNFDVHPNEFPCDMFAFMFGVDAWRDTDNDYFCETVRTKATWTNKMDGVTYNNMPVDEAYLYDNATAIIPNSANASKVSARKLKACSYLTSAASGLVWVQSGAGCTRVGSNTQVGTPDAPVLLVWDRALDIQGRVFGLVFVRTDTCTGPQAGSCTISPTTGGNGTLDMNAGAAVYGSVVIQGVVDKANGTSAVIYNESVLNNLSNEPAFKPFGPVPGSWTDNAAYSF